MKMLEKLLYFFYKIKSFMQNIDSYRIYNYIDFKFENDDTLKYFETYKKKLESYRKDPNDIIHYEMRTDLFTYNMKTTDEITGTPKIVEYKTSVMRDLAHIMVFKNYEEEIARSIDKLNLKRDNKKFSFFTQYLNLDSIHFKPQSTPSNSLSNIAKKINNFFLYRIFSLKCFSKDVCVLPPDFFFTAIKDFSKEKVKEPHFKESSCLLNIKNMPQNAYRQYYVREITDKVNYQIICVNKETLLEYSLKTKKDLYFLSAFEIFCALYTLYPHLTHYTLVLQGNDLDSLCHYSYGFLDYVGIAKKTSGVYELYDHVDIVGEIFYCDYSGDRAYIENHKNIEACLDMPLPECLKILSFAYLSSKGLIYAFSASSFLRTRFILKVLVFSSCVLILWLLVNMCYNFYTYQKLEYDKIKAYENDLQDKVNSKKDYKPMYDRIYNHLETKKSLNFRFKNEN